MIGLGLGRLLRSYPGVVGAVILALAGILVAGVLTDPVSAWSGMLIAGIYGLVLATGAAVFAALSGASGAGWWIPLRRVAGSLAAGYAVPAAAIALTLGLGLKSLYPWARPGSAVAPDVARTWLAAPFFLARGFLVLLVLGFAVSFLRRGLEGDDGPATRARFGATAVRFVLVAAPCLAIGFWDWGMSLEAPWVSTMYAVYGFAMTILSGIALVAAAALLPGTRTDGALTAAHRHDLGKLLFAFGMFWAYIWFCQYLLVWYTNLPEEVPHYVARASRGYAPFFWLNPVLSFLVPFAALLGQGAKRSAAVLGQVAAVVLVGRWLDVYLLVAPAAGPVPVFPVHAVAATVLVLFGMGLAAERAAGPAPAPLRAVPAR